MDGEAQVVVAVLEVQDPGGSDQLPPQLLLQLDHLLPAQAAVGQEMLRARSPARPAQPSLQAGMGALHGDPPYLEDILRVAEAVDTDVVLERGAGGRREQDQLEALGGRHAEGLPDQGEASQLLGEDVASLRFQLAVVQLRARLGAQLQHILQHPGRDAPQAWASPPPTPTPSPPQTLTSHVPSHDCFFSRMLQFSALASTQ